MVFASSNAKEYYGINATTGNIEWTYRCEGAEEFILCSTIYNDGKLFLIDKFSIVCVDAKNGNPVWGTYLGDELYVSPSYADDKLYIATDQRSMYVLNATNGDKLGYFGTSSNSWSAPTIYEGRVYVGNNDWNVYCLDDSPVIYGEVSVELDKNEVKKGEAVTGSGQLSPGIAYAPVTVFFTKSDGTVDSIQVTASNDGAFSFNYTPEVVGDCIVSIWCSGASYIMHSVDIPINVAENQQTSPEQEQPTLEQDSGIPTEYVTAAAIIVIALIAVVSYWFMKKRNRGSPVLISD
jgi:outer membrane protein assembly factor BamB